ncbi:MAG: hypothetical protein ACOC3J_07995 [Gemmatimonadota bacterium]
MTARIAPLLLAVSCLTACFSYVPIETDQVVVGERVRMTVDPDAGRNVTGELDANLTGIRGTVLRSEPERLFVSLEVLETATGGELFWSGDPLALAPADILALEQRTFSWPRTIIFTMAIGVGLYALDQGMDLGISRVLVPKEDDPTGPEELWPTRPRP